VSSNVYLYLMLYDFSGVFVIHTYTSRECGGGWRWARVVVFVFLGGVGVRIQVVISRAFLFSFSPCNHFMNVKKLFLGKMQKKLC
jgi:hypothetical protein